MSAALAIGAAWAAASVVACFAVARVIALREQQAPRDGTER